MAYHEMFPEEFIQLNQELVHHPKLQELLSKHPQSEWEIMLAEIAAYCSIGLDDTYTPDELCKIAETCRKRLVGMRGLVVSDVGLVIAPANTLKH